MSRAQKWRNCLMGSPSIIFLLRKSRVHIDHPSTYFDDIHNDLKRTYPLDDFFTDHIVELSKILNTYAFVNEGMGYAQGMAFIVFALYKTFYEDDPVYAAEDTFFSFHKLVHVIRPAYPLNPKDVKVIDFNKNITSCVTLLVSSQNTHLALKVKELNIVPIFIQQNLPSLFCTKYSVEDCCLLFDFIIDKDQFQMFHRILCVMAGMILSIEAVIMNMNFESILGIMQNKGCYKIRRVLCHANSVI